MGSETAIIRLDRPVPGFDHTKSVDLAELCDVVYSVDTDAGLLELEPLKSFGAWPGMKPRWWPASAGLQTVRGLIAHYEARATAGVDSVGGMKSFALPKMVAVLRQLEAALDKADTHDRRFYIAVGG